MIVVLHVIVALTSLGYSGYVYVSPSTGKLRLTYALVALTVGSGTVLVVQSHGHLLEACMLGILYLGVVTIAIVSARRKLAAETIKN